MKNHMKIMIYIFSLCSLFLMLGCNSYENQRPALQKAITDHKFAKYSESLREFKRLAGKNNPVAMCFYAGYLKKGKVLPKDDIQADVMLDKALPGLKELAEKGDAFAQERLGQMFEWKRSYADAVNWYQKAADQGNSMAQMQLASIYARSNKYMEAYNLFLKAADQDEANAQFNLGYFYESGKGVAPNLIKAEQWYRKAAEQGHPRAQRNLGVLYAEGIGVPQDYKEAAKWFQKAADIGDVLAQGNIGFLYQNGLGVEKNEQLAYEYYKKGAEKGDLSARQKMKVLAERLH